MPRVSTNPTSDSRGSLRHFASDESMESKIGKRVTVRRDGCWIMDGKPEQYASVGSWRNVDNVTTKTGMGGRESAHRYFYRTFVGPIPPHHHIHHTCFNKGCVNPRHLELLSAQEHGRLHQELDPMIPKRNPCREVTAA